MSFPLEDALAAAKGLGGSLNDWFVTGVVNGAVAYHDARGVPLRTLNTSFVVSTRADKAIGGNSFTPSRFSAPAGPMDPADRFKLLSETMADKRVAGHPGQGALSGLAGLANLLPTSLVTSIARSPGGEDGLRHVQPAQLEARASTCRAPGSTSRTRSGRSPARRST